MKEKAKEIYDMVNELYLEKSHFYLNCPDSILFEKARDAGIISDEEYELVRKEIIE